MLMYHSVMPGHNVPDWPWAVSASRFEAQLDALQAGGWHTVTQSELASDAHLPARTVAITFDDGYADNLFACEALARRGMCATWFIVSGFIGKTPRWTADGRPPQRLLDASELRDMQRVGMEIGAHSVSHRRLTELDDMTMELEVADSRKILAETLGTSVSSFAYPYGDWDARCAKAVEAAGYGSASTTRTGWAKRDDNPYTLRRLTVFNTDTASTLIRKVSLGSHEIASSALLKQMGRQVVSKMSAGRGRAG
jgi:peptidoglycan/xylan/chitin deacetylase (PgdA/CDA1 family)